MRPGDANGEVVECWRVIMQTRHEPIAIVLSRQALPTLDRTKYARGIRRGEEVPTSSRTPRIPRVILDGQRKRSLARVAIEDLRAIDRQGAVVASRVVSMPCWELFEHQSQEYRDSVLPPAITARVLD